MRTRILLAALCCLLAVAPTAAGERHETQRTFTWETAAGEVLAFQNLLGSIELHGGGPEGQVAVEATIEAEADTLEAAQALTSSIDWEESRSGEATLRRVVFPTSRHTGFRLPSTLRKAVTARFMATVLRKDPLAVDYAGSSVYLGPAKGAVPLAVRLKITVPLDAEVRLKQALGSIRAVRVRGSVEVESEQGPVMLERLFGRAKVSAAAGVVAVMTAKGEAIEIETQEAEVELSDIHVAEVAVRTGDGKVVGQEIRGKRLDVKSAGAPIELGAFEVTDFNIETGAGKIDLDPMLQRTKQASIRTGAGDVTLRLGQIAPFVMKVHSASEVKHKGFRVETEPTADGQLLRRGRGGASVEVVTSGGQVMLKTR